MRLQLALRVCCVLCCLTHVASAAEPILEFLDGLRGRRYFDTAVQYLDQLEAQGGLPTEIAQVISYERGQILLSSAQELTNLDAQRRQLDAAQAAFEQFVNAAPGHALAGQANSARAKILLEKARVEIWTGEKPSNAGSRVRFQESARELIAQARQVFESAEAQHKATWESFPTFIPDEEADRRAARDQAEVFFIEAQLDLAMCLYWEAQTHNRGDEARTELLVEAAAEFEAIHSQFRSQVGGLMARIWQGKCFEEQNEIGIALGIYEELLGHEGRTNNIRNLKDLALRYRLICLNHEKRNDHALVIAEAEDWLKQFRARAQTSNGLWIQWELCRAREELGTDESLAELARKTHLTQALARARTINKYPGELKSPSAAMIQRLMVGLNRDPGDPRDFETAYGSGGQLFEEIETLNNSIRNAVAGGKMDDARQLQDSLRAVASEMARLNHLALKLATPQTEPLLVGKARVRLAYGYLLQDRYFDAAAVANHQMMKHNAEDFADLGREAGFIAMTAFDSAYAAAEEGNRDFEAQMVTRSAERLAEQWPDSDRANDARNVVALLNWNSGDLLTAAEWWEKIPTGTSQYIASQIRAGHAYWRQYVLEAGKSADERADAEELAEWKKQAVERLEIGVGEAERTTPSDRSLSDDQVRAKLTLVTIRNLDGVYQTTADGTRGALELLTAEPHAVLSAIDVPEGESRPDDPNAAQSTQIASVAYQQLLRTQIGLKDLNAARAARKKLERIAAGEDDAALTQVFVDFGRELEQELERLRASGETRRLAEVRSGFEAFLNDLYERQDGQTFYSLLWIAETFTSLADGTSDRPAKADEFYTKAVAAYRLILDQASADSEFLSNPSQLPACKLRLVNCLIRKQDFSDAEAQIFELLRESPNAPDAQFAAAKLYQSWGGDGGIDSWRKYETALYGKKEPVNVWGWTYTAQALQRALYGNQDPDLARLHFDARYNLAQCESEFGLNHPEQDQQRAHFERARASIVGFQRISNRWPDDEYLRFNALYKTILLYLGSPVADLPRQLLDTKGARAPEEVPEADILAHVEVAGPSVNSEDAPRSNRLLIVAMIAIGTAAVSGLYFLAVGQNKKRHSAALTGSRKPASRTGEEPVVFPGLPPARQAVKKKKPAPASAARPTQVTKQSLSAKPQRKRPKPPSDS